MDYLDLFKKACRKEDYEHAQAIIDTAFVDAEQRAQLDNRLLWCVYNLASRYLSKGKYQKAKKLYEQSIHMKEKIMGRNHPRFSDMLERLALLQFKTKQTT